MIQSTAKATSEEYSVKVGEEAATVNLALTIEVLTLRYKTEDVNSLITATIDQAVPPGYMKAELPSQVELTAESIDDAGETVKGVAKVQIALLPTWDQAVMTRQLKGTRPADAAGIVGSMIPGVTGVTTRMNPKWWPPRLLRLPYNPQKIKLLVTPQVI